MAKIEDEMLMAYADDELTGKDAEATATALENDPALRARLERHHALNTSIDLAFRTIDEQPLPPAIMDLVAKHKQIRRAHAEAGKSGSTESFVERWRAFWADMRAPSWQQGAVAASLFLVVGLFVFQQSNTDVQQGFPVQMARLLDTLADNVAADGVLVQESYLRTDGAFCRTYLTGTESRLENLACRPQGETWQLVATGTLPPKSAFLPAGEGKIDALIGKMQPLPKGDEITYLNQK